MVELNPVLEAASQQTQDMQLHHSKSVFRASFKFEALLVTLLCCSNAFSQAVNLYDQVNPFIGTSGGGLTSPAASLPFGMIQWGPTTNEKGYYLWEDTATRGFSLTHLDGVGCPVGSDIPVLPWSHELRESPGEIGTPFIELAQGFEHSQEEAHLGYYAVTFANGIRVELTVTNRAGIARFTFPPKP